MAPTDVLHTYGLLEQEDHRMSEVALTIAQGLLAAFKLGENHLPCVLPIRDDWDVHATVCMAMAWSSAHTGLLPVVMYVCKSMETVAGS